MSSGTLHVQCKYLLMSCKINFYAAPSPPSDVDVSQNGIESLLVSWTAGESIVTGYIISYQQQDGVHSDSVNVNETVISTIITGLMIGATYSISVVATSSTLPSNETIPQNITIGNGIYAELGFMLNCDCLCVWLWSICTSPRASHHLPDLLSLFLHYGWRQCNSHLYCHST